MDRADYSAAQICTVLANIHRTKDAKTFLPGDFLPRLIDEEDEDTEPEVVIDIEAQSKALMAMLGRKEDGNGNAR